MMFNSKPSFVIFDWDGTIVDTHGAIRVSFTKACHDVGVSPPDNNDVAYYSSRSARDYLHKLYPDNWQMILKKYYDYYKDCSTQELRLVPGVLSLIQMLHDNKIKMSVVSNKIGDLLRNEVKHFSLQEYFHMVVGSADAEEDKPSIKPLELAVIGCDNITFDESIFMIGDSDTDILCANNAKIRSLYYNPCDHKLESNLHYDYVFRDFAELRASFSNLI